MLHLNRPSSTRFVVRKRLRGLRRYILVGKPTRSLQVATRRLADCFADSSKMVKCGDILMTADYYDPIILIEMKRK